MKRSSNGQRRVSSVDNTLRKVIKTKFNDTNANSTIDSGAGVLAMDMGSLEGVKLGDILKK